MAAPVIMGQQISVEEGELGLRVEVLGLVPPHKIAARHTDRPQDFLRVTFAARGDLWLLTAPRPCAIQGGRLAEGRFVFIHDHRPFALGVIFRFGRV